MARPLPRWVVVALLLFVLALAAFLRFYRFGQVPPGPHYDEASKLFDARDVLAGHVTPFSLRPYGREMLHVYVSLPLVVLLGYTDLALRIPTAIIGILTPLAVYLLVQELLGDRNKRLAQWTGLLAALFLALSYWAVTINHLGFRANYVPLTETLCFLFFWRALRTDRLRDYALSGLFLGLGLNTYINSRFVPLVLVLFVFTLLLTTQGRSLVLPRWSRWLLLAGAALVAFGPLLVFFITHPGTFMMRAGGLSIFSPALNHGNPLGLLVRSVLGNLGIFGFTGDPNWVFNIPGRPGLDPILSAFFWLGVILCLLRWREPRHLFLLIWWAVMLLPSILAPDPIPHFLRAFAVLPAACILAATGLTQLASFVLSLVQKYRPVVVSASAGLVLVYAGWSGYTTWHTYYDVWAQRDEVYYAYYGHMADLARQMNADTDPLAVYLFPVNYDRKGEDYHEYALELLHSGPVPFHYIIADDATVARDLTDYARDKKTIRLVVWTNGEHVDADPRGLLPFYLSRFGQLIKQEEFRGYRIVTYELPSTTVDFSVPLEVEPVQANLGNELILEAESHPTGSSSGGFAWLALRWKAGETVAHDYKVSVRLSDSGGRLVGQSDTLLLSNEHRPASQWQPGQEESSYHLLSTLPATMPGLYRLSLVVYDPETLRPLPVVDQGGTVLAEEIGLGQLQIGRPGQPPEPQIQFRIEPAPLAPDLNLVGYDLPGTDYRPGDTLSVALYWQALADVTRDYQITMQLVDAAGNVVQEWSQPPAYPTSEWASGDVWRDWHDLPLGLDLPTGAYTLQAAIGGSYGEAAGHAQLGSIGVQGRTRTFEVPPMEYLQQALLGDSIKLLGYDLAADPGCAAESLGQVLTLQPASCSLHLTLYWQAVARSAVSYTVFTHLLDAGSRVSAQKDGIPLGGSAPTTSWSPGEVVSDRYDLQIDPVAPSGDYALEIGMYRAETNQRLPVFDTGGQPLGDRLILDTVVRVR